MPYKEKTDRVAYQREKMRKLFQKWLPIYFQFPNKLWLAIWAAPKVPATAYDYFRALRITVRGGTFHHRIIRVIKRGQV